ncbi:teichoic acids export ATP-binding protein TagH [bacterium BMS3Bbin14]|nr:teichoic acids export ATP-binding protein TagH [bacterium BMS3Abin13]GBE53101.1 teichoic acids export ATP-binding protein TagH [bacterium BMS3Bbin14]HDO30596.1 ABC transporter ATP-binding protein [Desulfobacteraceae bacterium]HDZ75920.1 ABC transporter ATP-binding protein [Desulfobacteraceae bacterium]
MTTVISIENLWKEYRLGVIGHGTLIHDLQSWWARVHGKEDPNAKISPMLKGQEKQIEGDHFWALRDINLEVKEGEVLGIIGKNGAGKSTLLKVLSRVTAPTRGCIKVKGRIASLLEVGTGFHPELTGRENIYLNGAILGMTKLEVKRKLDEIIEFSGVDQYIDTPVKRYSSGMRVRLAFSVAAHLDPEILVIDEVLAVGDAEFQKKCIGKMGEVARAGRTVIFVSHNMVSIEKLCEKATIVSCGQLQAVGSTAAIVQDYLSRNLAISKISLSDRTDRKGNGSIRFTGYVLKSGDDIVKHFRCGEESVIEIDFQNIRHEDFYLEIGFGIDDYLGRRVALISTDISGNRPIKVDKTVNRVRVTINRNQLVPGEYKFTLFARVNSDVADWVRDAGNFVVGYGDYYKSGKLPERGQGVFLPDYKIEAF